MQTTQLILAIGMLAALTACPDSGGTGPITTVGSGGGGIKAADGGSASSGDQKSKLFIPKNGLSKDATVTIAASSATGTIPSGQAIVPGSTIAISASDGATLSSGTLTLTFDPAKIAPLSSRENPSNLTAKADPSSLRLYQLVAGGWKIVNGIPTINQTTLTQIINEFGLYALFATPSVSGGSGDSVNFDQLSADANLNASAFKPSVNGTSQPSGALSKARVGTFSQDQFSSIMYSDDGGNKVGSNRYDDRQLQVTILDVGDGIVTGKEYTPVALLGANGQTTVLFTDWYESSGPGTTVKTAHEWVATSGTVRVKAFSKTRVDLEIVNAVFAPKDFSKNKFTTNEAKGSFRINTTFTNISPIIGFTNGIQDK
jgi:hypothetical protein